MKKRIIALVMLALMMAAILIPVAQAACKHTNCRWETPIKPTCISTGKEVRICNDCGKTVQTNILKKVAHSYGNADHSLGWEPATCQKAGYEYRPCTTRNCTAKKKETINKVDHDFLFVQVLAHPTCTTPGKLEHKCRWCPKHEYPGVPALGHMYINGTCDRCGKPKN